MAGIVVCGHCGKPLGKERNKLVCYTYRSKKACEFHFRIDYGLMLNFTLGLLKEYVYANREKILRKLREMENKREVEEEIKKLERKLENLLELYAETPSQKLKEKIKEFQDRIEKLRKERNLESFDLEKALNNLEKLSWKEPDYTSQVLRLFIKRIVVFKKGDNVMEMKVEATPHLASILQKVMVSRAGLEPATHGLKGRCSTN